MTTIFKADNEWRLREGIRRHSATFRAWAAPEGLTRSGCSQLKATHAECSIFPKLWLPFLILDRRVEPGPRLRYLH